MARARLSKERRNEEGKRRKKGRAKTDLFHKSASTITALYLQKFTLSCLCVCVQMEYVLQNGVGGKQNCRSLKALIYGIRRVSLLIETRRVGYVSEVGKQAVREKRKNTRGYSRLKKKKPRASATPTRQKWVARKRLVA